ncbi:MAG: Gfo/Idh/MocA family oxidoreductase [Balneolaceae bacterium]
MNPDKKPTPKKITPTGKNPSSRRNFLKKSALGLASFAIVPRFVLGGPGYVAPSDKITLGFIGTGKLSPWLSRDFLKLNDTQMVAACDVDSVKVGKFQESVNTYYAEETNKNEYEGCDGYSDYNELLERSDIDAVIICLPDHWHAVSSIAAMKAGKDVYCEKPLAHTIAEGRAMVNAARAYERVVQTGSMQRSWRNFRHACELVRNGYLGEISQVKVNVGGPAIACNLADQPIPDSLNWDRWIGPASYRGYHDTLSPPYPIEIWPLWRRYKEFGGGGVADWGAHMFDIAQWALGMDHTGPVEITPPKEKTADRGVIFKYANGIEMTHEDFGRGNAVRFIGSEGTLDISREFLEPSNPELVNHKIDDNEINLYQSDNHYQDFIDAIKTREKPGSDVEIGHRTSTICCLGNLAYELGRTLRWNPDEESFIDDPEANKLRGKEFRAPYVL